jgi:glyoxylase-like metal-dependent hydrolase (beta-lactamase superfamily II)
MRNTVSLLAAAVVAVALTGAAKAADPAVDRLYVLDCGENHGKDQGRWSPGVNAGQPILFSDNCYLIRHGKQWLLWDTGIPDEVAAMPNGMETGGGSITAKRSKTLVGQLAQLKVKPDDIAYVAISHNHGDHSGNAKKFAKSTFLVQQAEWDFAYADPTKSPLPQGAKVTKLNGDHDVFGDGSVIIISTPGHTPGHQSLLVHLRKTGPVLLSGDAVHFKDNWDNRRVPSMNSDKDQTVASMARLDSLSKSLKATLWINHDKPQTDTLPKAPKYLQ